MSDDGSTRKVKAVRRKAQTPVAEQTTRPVKAVKRKPQPLGDRTPVLYTPQRISVLPGWRFEVRDMGGGLRFTLSLGLQKLVMRKLTIFAPGGEELGRLEQRFSLMEVKFDILNPDGSLRFTLYQPAEKYTVYEIRDGDFCMARISKDKPPPMKGMRDMLKFVDAFRVDLESSMLDERDRVLIIAAAIFMDRVFHTGEKD